MHKQNRTDREIGLENIMESMYSEKHTTKTCEHCKGTGKHDIKTAAGVITKDCDKCKGSGEVVVKWEEDGAKDHVPPHDKDKLKRAKKRGYDSKKDGEVKCSKCGEVHLLSAGCGKPHTEADIPYDGLDDQNRRAEDEHENLLHVRSFFGGKDFIGWAGDKMREIGKDTFEAKWEKFIQDLEGNADTTGRLGLGSDRSEDKWST